MKHAPTPWTAHYNEERCQWEIYSRDSVHMHAMVFGCPVEMDEANARLMAASPKLIDALTQILPLVKHADESDPSGGCDIDFTGVCDCLYDLAMKDARTAIDLAKTQEKVR